MRWERPEGWWLLGLAVPLVLLHLHWRRRRFVEVSSLLPWAELAGEGLSRRGMRRLRDALALATLLAALAAFAAALADPVTGEAAPAPRRLAIVLDASVTMNARVQGGRTRFDAARQAAAAAIRRAGPDDVVTVWLATDEPRVLVDPTTDQTAAAAALETAGPTLRPRGLALTTRLARRAAPGTRRRDATVLVLTDRPGVAEGIGRVREEGGAVPVLVGVVGGDARARNAGIVAAGPDPRDRATLVVRVAVTDGGADPRTLVVLHGGETVARTDLSFGPDRTATARLAAGAAATRGGLAEVRLDPPDDFPEDDAARLVLPAPRRLRVAVVAERPSPFLVEALRAMPEVVDAAGTTLVVPGAPREAFAAADVVVADVAAGVAGGVAVAGAADAPDELPALVFAAAGARAVERPLLWGVGAHPVLDGVDLSPLRMDRAVVLAPAAGETVLVAAAEGAVGTAREHGGARRITLGFRPEATTLPLEAAFPLLVRNALRWLAGEPLLPAWLGAGGPLATTRPLPPGAREVWIEGPGDAAPRAAAVEDGWVTAPVPYPPPGGPYALRLRVGDESYETVVRWVAPPEFAVEAPGEVTALYGPPAADAVAALPDRRAAADTRRRHAGAFALAGALALVLGAVLEKSKSRIRRVSHELPHPREISSF